MRLIAAGMLGAGTVGAPCALAFCATANVAIAISAVASASDPDRTIVLICSPWHGDVDAGATPSNMPAGPASALPNGEFLPDPDARDRLARLDATW